MSRQYFADILSEPLSSVFTTISATTETVLIPTLSTPIPAGEPRAGKVYHLIVGGTCTTGSSGTLIITPRLGTTISGTALGGSPTQTVVPSITTAPFKFEYYLVFRSIGQAGANSKAVGYGVWESNGAIATAASETSVHCGTVGADISVDTSIANALWIGVTFSVAPSVIPIWHVWESLN